MRWERFCNWLEAEPWRWHYVRIWRGVQGDPPFLRRLWWTVSFPHVHHEDDDVFDAKDAFERIVRLRAKWEAPDVGGDQAWAAVGSEAHKIASDYLARKKKK